MLMRHLPTLGAFSRFSAAPPNVPTPGAPVNPARPVEVFFLQVLSLAIVAVLLLYLGAKIPVPVLPE